MPVMPLLCGPLAASGSLVFKSVVTLQKGPDSSAPTVLRKPFGVDGGICGLGPQIPPSTPNVGEPPQVASRPEELQSVSVARLVRRPIP